ncbi:MAG: type IV secretory system conjugative DNA transfer family protein [Acidobacteriota bacterium]
MVETGEDDGRFSATPEIVYYWRREFPLLTGRPQAPLLTRLDPFLRPRLIRHMVNQTRDRLDVRWMMDARKIFLAKLAQGAIGEENAHLLGTLIVTKLHQMALGRQNLPEAERTPFYVYVDEFHNFITPSIAAILSGARKFGLGLILSHQELRQVVHHSADVAGAVIANPYTRICFRLGDDDAKRLQSGFASFSAQDLQSLGVGEAIVRLERAEHDFTLHTLPAPTVDAAVAQRRRERIVAYSRERYARRREDVERDLAEARGRETAAEADRRPPKRFGPPRRPTQG